MGRKTMWNVALLYLLTWGATPVPGYLVTQLGDSIHARAKLIDPIPEELIADPKLILTPYIESGHIEEAQNLSAVSGDHFSKDIPSYSGYLTVNKEYNSNLFFWFFPAENDYKNAPVLLWLQGGPGGTSMFGLFQELGPYTVSEDGATIIPNPYSWHKNHSLIFIDNPVGSGFSFTENEKGYAREETQIGRELYEAIIQFLTLFPELQKLPFFLAGESYAGKYVPVLGHTIHTQNPTADLKVNLQGIAVGNGLTDPISQLQHSDFAYQLGIVDTQTYNIMKNNEELARKLFKSGDAVGAQYYSSSSVAFIHEANISVYNFLEEAHGFKENHIVFLRQSDVRRAIHVGNSLLENISPHVHSLMYKDLMTSVRPYLEKLLEHYRVLYYSGQLDIIVAYALSVNMYNKLQFSAAEEYRNATRVPWFVDKQLAGYMKTAGKFTEVLVRNAGHAVPGDQPAWAFDLINKFTRNNLFSENKIKSSPL